METPELRDRVRAGRRRPLDRRDSIAAGRHGLRCLQARGRVQSRSPGPARHSRRSL